jgi:alpha/beta superfamily hydrolase
MAVSSRLNLQVQGRAVEAVLEQTEEQPAKGLAVVAHPHPLYGGTMDNKVVQTLARAFVQTGWNCLRFNFRGVGQSEGVYDEGRGETQDLLALVEQLAPTGPLALAGFSFGAFVAAQALQTLWPSGRVHKTILVGTAVPKFPAPVLPEDAHAQALVVHGELDDTVALAGVMDWARPQQLPITVVPSGGHFFHGQLPLLKTLALRHLQA